MATHAEDLSTLTERGARARRELTLSLFHTSLAALYVQLDVCQKRGRQRLLTRNDIDHFVDGLTCMVQHCRAVDIPLEAICGYCDGGAVPNNYAKAYAAKTTRLELVRNKSMGAFTIRRTRARSRSYGDAGKLRLGVVQRVDAVGWTGTGGLWRPKEIDDDYTL